MTTRDIVDFPYTVFWLLYSKGFKLFLPNMLNINFRENKWAIFFCGVSTLGALCYGYDQIYYTGVLGMRRFVDDYGTTTDPDTGKIALTTSFLSLTASIIYVGERKSSS